MNIESSKQADRRTKNAKNIHARKNSQLFKFSLTSTQKLEGTTKGKNKVKTS